MPESLPSCLRLNATLSALSLHCVQLDIEQPTANLTHIFETNPQLPGVLLYQAGQFVGMIARQAFFERMSRPYSLELFARKPIAVVYQFIDMEPLVLPVQLSIQSAAKRVLQRPDALLYEPLVVKCQLNEYGLLEVHQLLLAQAQIHDLALLTLQQSQQALADEKELAQITLHSIGDAVITTDQTERVKSLNPVAESLTGWLAVEAVGLPLAQIFQIVHEDTHRSLVHPVEAVLQQGQTVGLANHTLLVARDGQEFAIHHSAAPIRDRQGNLLGAVLVFRDVTQERSLARQLAWQAHHDLLTGLANRRAFEQQLQTAHSLALTSGQMHTLCYLDLDRFKIINDTCGHLAGDALLRQVSRLLEQQIRCTDILARLGGDEFALLLRQCPLAEGLVVAQSVRQCLQAFRFTWEGQCFAIGVSIGLTGIDANTLNLTSAMHEADTACYWAKKQGRNQVQVYKQQGAHTVHTSEAHWVNQITRALAEDRFQLYYQTIAPLVPQPGFAEHYEVLLRLLDTDGQVVTPGTFMPTAERYNLMPEIDRWVIRTLFASQGPYYRQVWQQCQAQNLPCHCLYAVNLSGASLNDGNLVPFIQQQLAQHQIPPQLLCFEITETVAIANLAQATQVIGDLKQLGCRFALDDFGSGMSSFRYLNTLPVDFLKIDGSFVSAMADNLVASTTVEAIHRIGQVMGLQTIAECVENEAILAEVRAIGVHYAQGFGIAVPQPLMTKFEL